MMIIIMMVMMTNNLVSASVRMAQPTRYRLSRMRPNQQVVLGTFLCGKLRVNPLAKSPSPNHHTLQSLPDENPSNELVLEPLLPARHYFKSSFCVVEILKQPHKASATTGAILQMRKLRQREVNLIYPGTQHVSSGTTLCEPLPTTCLYDKPR